MKKLIPLLGLIFSGFFLLAQPGPDISPDEFKKVEAYKVKFITDKLDLSAEEAQKFWPVYNEYSKKLQEIHERRLKGMSRADIKEKWEELDDQTLKAIALQELQNQADIAELKKLYFQKFEDAVGIRKAATFFRSEIEFHKHLMELLGRRRGKR